MAIQRLAIVSVPVSDQERALGPVRDLQRSGRQRLGVAGSARRRVTLRRRVSHAMPAAARFSSICQE